jgi:hypothetical protein
LEEEDDEGGELDPDELPVEEPPVEVEEEGGGAEVVGGGAKLATFVTLLFVRFEPG